MDDEYNELDLLPPGSLNLVKESSGDRAGCSYVHGRDIDANSLSDHYDFCRCKTIVLENKCRRQFISSRGTY